MLGAEHARGVRRGPAPRRAPSARHDDPTPTSAGARSRAPRSTSTARSTRATWSPCRPAPTPPPCSSTSSATRPTRSPAGGRTALSDRPLSDAAGADVRRLRGRQHRCPHPRRARHGRRQDRVARAAGGAAEHLLPRSPRRARAVGRADDGALRRPRPQCAQRGRRAGGAPGGPEVFRRLAATADVVVENFRPRRARPLRLWLRRPAGGQPAAVDAVDLGLRPHRPPVHATPRTPRTSATTSG